MPRFFCYRADAVLLQCHGSVLPSRAFALAVKCCSVGLPLLVHSSVFLFVKQPCALLGFEAGPRPNLVAYNAAVSACAHSRQQPRSLDIPRWSEKRILHFLGFWTNLSYWRPLEGSFGSVQCTAASMPVQASQLMLQRFPQVSNKWNSEAALNHCHPNKGPILFPSPLPQT
jgi:hypothetical protein